jgi:hypothetical protein
MARTIGALGNGVMLVGTVPLLPDCDRPIRKNTTSGIA